MLEKMSKDMLNNTCPCDVLDNDNYEYRLFHYNLHCMSLYVLVVYYSELEPTVLDYKLVPELAMYRLKSNGSYCEPELFAMLDDNGNQRFMVE